MLSNEFIKISISDTGVGVTGDKIQKVFDPFFTNKDGGTGLGLSIAFSIVEGHKGIIKIDSQEQKGTTIVIILPRHQEGDSYEENSNC
jgi:signal transduction histidine kinase